MFKKIALAAVVCFGTMAVSQTAASAGDCYRGHRYSSGFSYRPSVGIHQSYMINRFPNYYRPPVHRHVHPHVYAPYPAYRYGYTTSRYRYGYGGFHPYSRGGISIGIGF